MRSTKKQAQQDTFWDTFLDRPDGFERSNNDSRSYVMMLIFINAIMLAPPDWRVRSIMIAWPIIGSAVLYWRLGLEAQAYHSNRWTEFMIGWKLWTEIFLMVYHWPFYVLGNLFGDPRDYSFRSKVKSIHIEEIFSKVGRKQHAYDSAMEMFGYNVSTAERESERLQAIPGELVLTARTTGACGATAVTMLTTVSTASAAGPVPTGTNSVSISASGWVTTTETIPEHGQPEPALEYARTFITVTDPALRSSLFIELDADALQSPDPNVLNRYFLNTDLGNQAHLNIGRMFVAAGWTVPAPNTLETVNYPRYPFTFQGYALELDTVRGPWHVIADVSGATGLSFLDKGQFARAETSGHIVRSFGSAYDAALTWQMSDQFDRVSLDWHAAPLPWFDARGMIYYDNESPRGTGQTASVGSYAYAGVRPFAEIPGLSFHGQADYKDQLQGIETQPLILTGGLRMQWHNGKYSTIVDYQAGFGSSKAAAANALLFSFQWKF